MDKNHDVTTFISKYFYFNLFLASVPILYPLKTPSGVFRGYKMGTLTRNGLRRPGVGIFNGIIKIVTMFIKAILKGSDISRTQGVCHVIHIFFGSSLGKV